MICYAQDIHFGEKFSRDWSDSGEEPVKEGLLHGPKGLAGQLMRKHDSEAGRRAIRSRMQRVCKCHGECNETLIKDLAHTLPQQTKYIIIFYITNIL